MITIAIDGPAGAGKSTIAREVARSIGARYLDTGALYRAVALACIQRRVAPDDADAVVEVARSIDIDLEAQRVLLDGNDVTSRIRDADVTESVSVVAQHAGVRAVLLERQRELARRNDLVAEGRDMATVVFPDADLKVYLTASLEERARRRALELGLDGGEAEALREAIAKRDATDSSRDESPLTRAPDAEVIDTTGMSPEEVVRRIVELVGERR